MIFTEALARLHGVAIVEMKANSVFRNKIQTIQQTGMYDLPFSSELFLLGHHYRQSNEGSDYTGSFENKLLWRLFCTERALEHMRRAPNLHFWWWLVGEAALSELVYTQLAYKPESLPEPRYGAPYDKGKIDIVAIKQGIVRVRQHIPEEVLAHLNKPFEQILGSPQLFAQALDTGCLLMSDRYLYWNRLLSLVIEPEAPEGLELRTTLSRYGGRRWPFGPQYGFWDEEVFLAVPPDTPELDLHLYHGTTRCWESLSSLPESSMWWDGEQWCPVSQPIPDARYVFEMKSN